MANVLIWAKERKNYVTPLKIVSFQIKSPSKFGWKTAPHFGPDQNFVSEDDNLGSSLCEIPWSVLMKYRPAVLEIADSGCPFTEFMTKLAAENENSAAAETTTTNLNSNSNKNLLPFFDRVRFLRIYESNGDIDQLLRVIENCPTLSAIEFYESRLDDDHKNGGGKMDKQKLLAAISSRKELKALDLIQQFSGQQINEWFAKLRTSNIRILRFSGPPAVKYADLKLVNVSMPVVEFLAVQDLDTTESIGDHYDPTTNTSMKWHRDLLNRFCHMFPSLKYLYLDYKIFDTIFVFDEKHAMEGGEETKSRLEAIRDFFLRMKLVFLSVLVYCPDDQMKDSVKKAQKFLAQDCQIRTEVKYFFRGGQQREEESANFALFILGDQVHPRTEHLVEMIVKGKNSTPDLRHFCYVMDRDAFLNPQSTMAFGGSDMAMVKRMYEEEHISNSQPFFVPDPMSQRSVHG